jgi:Domain of unknown function (DUF6089)
MEKSLFAGLALLFCSFTTRAQLQSIAQDGEFGLAVGAAHYFGDLNPNVHLNQPKIALGVFFRKQYNNYIALRVSGSFAQLGYSDIYNTQNYYDLRRNLSFSTNIWEVAVQGDFNFFKFDPTDSRYRFTPYITLGVGAFSYNPYVFYQGQKVYLRSLGTEGQGSAAYPDRKPYGTMAVCFPFGVGVKYNFNARMNIALEIVYRFTTTDYLDDVSTTYAGAATFPTLPNGQPSLAALLQDPSYQTGTAIGIAGRQRGYGNQKDSYAFAQLMFSFNITSYHCPSAK